MDITCKVLTDSRLRLTSLALASPLSEEIKHILLCCYARSMIPRSWSSNKILPATICTKPLINIYISDQINLETKREYYPFQRLCLLAVIIIQGIIIGEYENRLHN